MTLNLLQSLSLRFLFAAVIAVHLLLFLQPSVAASERLTPKDIAVAEPLQVPLSANKPTAEKPVEAAAVPAAEAPAVDAPAGGAADTQAAPAAATGGGPEKRPAAAPSPPPTREPTPRSSPSTAAAPAKPTSGWLGLIVDDSLVTGRLVVVEVGDPSPARAAGIRPRDVLLAIDGESLQTADQLAAVLAAIPPQKQVRALIGRTDGVKEVTMTASVRPAVSQAPAAVAVAAEAPTTDSAAAAPAASRFSSAPASPAPKPPSARPPAVTPPKTSAATPPPSNSAGSRYANAASPPAPLPTPQANPIPAAAGNRPVAPGMSAASPAGRTALGVRTVAIDTVTQARYRLAQPSGAYVLGVVDSLPASRAGLPPGSVIVAFDNRPVRSPKDLTALVTGTPAGRQVSLDYVLPGGETRRADIELQVLEPALERALIGVPAVESGAARRTSRRPVVPAAAEQASTPPLPGAAAAEMGLLQQELQLLREELLRVRNRLDRLESGRPAGGRPRGEAVR